MCAEALRLVRLVASHPATASPAADALAALMAFQAARLPARTDDAGDLVVLEEQDRARWDRRLLALGFEHLARAAVTGETGWPEILALYDQHLAIAPSPVVALNRAVAVARVEGAEAGLAALGAIERFIQRKLDRLRIAR